VITQDVGVRGLAAHKFETYKETVEQWAKKWKENLIYGPVQHTY
jgi:hypothetical protein